MIIYKIFIETSFGRKLNYTVDSYKQDGNRIIFFDKLKNTIKNFDSRNCEIEEIHTQKTNI